jgi:hypothetical protein
MSMICRLVSVRVAILVGMGMRHCDLWSVCDGLDQLAQFEILRMSPPRELVTTRLTVQVQSQNDVGSRWGSSKSCASIGASRMSLPGPCATARKKWAANTVVSLFGMNIYCRGINALIAYPKIYVVVLE